MRFEIIDCGGVYLADPAGGALALMAHQGLSPGFLVHVSHFPPGSPNVNMAMTGKARYGRYADIRPTMDEIREKEGLRATAFIPIMSRDQLIAVLNLASHSHDSIPAETRISLETLALQIGSTLMRLRSDAALRESERKYRSIVGNSVTGLFKTTTDGRMLHSNDALAHQDVGAGQSTIHPEFGTQPSSLFQHLTVDMPAVLRHDHGE